MTRDELNPNPLPMLSEADEKAIDSLLDQIHSTSSKPPDLTVEILCQLSQGSTFLPKVERVSRSSRGAYPAEGKRVESRRSRWFTMAAGVAALAASVALIWIQLDLSPVKNLTSSISSESSRSPDAAHGELALENGGLLEKDRASNRESIPVIKSPLRRDGVPLVRSEGANKRSDKQADALPQKSIVDYAGPVADSMAVSLKRFDESLSQYWTRIGVVPASEVDATTLANRVEERFGAKPRVAKDSVVVEAAFTDDSSCELLATRLVDGLFKAVPLMPDAKPRMILEATKVISAGGQFDELIATWMADPSLFNEQQPDQLAQNLAINLLDADASCARCHDSPVDGRFAQHDYWSFASIFVPAEQPPLFYELEDGRQKVAEPHVPSSWLKQNTNSDQVIASTEPASVTAFAGSLRASQTLAGAIANRLWEIGFDSPLLARASTLLTPPRDEALQSAHRELTEWIIANRFDVRAAARFVVSTNAMRRGPSDLFLDNDWQLANEAALASATLSQRAFASSKVRLPSMNQEQLLAAFEARVGNIPRAIRSSETVLAQPSGSDPKAQDSTLKPTNPRPDEMVWARWVADRTLLRDSWLHWIKNPTQRQLHAYYANGVTNAQEEPELLQRLTAAADDKANAIENANDRLAWLLMQQN